jgi:hypothetical protein
MHKNVRSNPWIGKNKTNGVADSSESEFVGVEEQWSNR